MTSLRTLHVVPDALGGWHVQREGEPNSLSDHGSATDAELAAARRSDTREIVLHDRYGRTRRIAGLSA